jgi:hypothetical protein
MKHKYQIKLGLGNNLKVAETWTDNIGLNLVLVMMIVQDRRLAYDKALLIMTGSLENSML